ncbi:ATP-dependent zinc metalloprotease FTSH 3, mitochondrial [Porphyridium purpureum]|uniref:ATP-dependent zinc metalloprotease FTSH 3, mitochondrial n=1 Tax=Porphyridium purpureum TaxID=35688 RepID=A0A5J4YXL1_PORPP|nr:ATP-dependent zinc metalloprotease FTSH 3, mitochondrial [Porphyridium purpureum]|eukprot:POR3264..scf209_3
MHARAAVRMGDKRKCGVVALQRVYSLMMNSSTSAAAPLSSVASVALRMQHLRRVHVSAQAMSVAVSRSEGNRQREYLLAGSKSKWGRAARIQEESAGQTAMALFAQETPPMRALEHAMKRIVAMEGMETLRSGWERFEEVFKKMRESEANKDSPQPSHNDAAAGEKGTKDTNKADKPGVESEAKSSKSGEGEEKGAPGGGSGPEDQVPWFQQLMLATMIMVFAAYLTSSEQQEREISFQTFVAQLLIPRRVERIEVVNKTVAKVYLRDALPPTASSSSSRAREHGQTHTSQLPTVDAWGSFGSNEWIEMDAGQSQRSSDLDREIMDNVLSGRDPTDGSAPTYFFNIGSIDTFERRLEEVQEELGRDPADYVPVSFTEQRSLGQIMANVLPTAIILGAGLAMLRGSMGGMAGGSRGGIFQVGKANPVIVKDGVGPGGKRVMFQDVAGLDEAKLEVMEFVDFLKDAKKYERLGAKIPKGALLVGPPGTGKTLLAKAAAGEASVPFFPMSGSDFIEMFVGVGPSRVRDLFRQAREAAPCIVFIDEIDAVGRARGRGGFSGGNDERENTLNALLVEMDGFNSTTGIVVLAGTNRADILDKALLRPGRFDRQISIDKPDLRGRKQIFDVHLKPLKMNVDKSEIAKKMSTLTPGFSGADIANICNEAALIAARSRKEFVELVDFEAATDRVIGGLEKKNKVITHKEKNIVAHHEAGHAIAGWFLKHADPLLKVSIVPRGQAALGFAQYLPEDRFLQSQDQLNDFMVMALGGRVAEQLIFGSITTGAQDDLSRITKAAYGAVSQYGMSEKLGQVYFPPDGGSEQFFKPFSEETAEMIDQEARKMVDQAYERCENLLKEHLDQLRAVAQKLLEKEVIHEDDLVELLGDRPHKKLVQYDEFVDRVDRDRAARMKTLSENESEAGAGDGTSKVQEASAAAAAMAAASGEGIQSGSTKSSETSRGQAGAADASNEKSDSSIPELS